MTTQTEQPPLTPGTGHEGQTFLVGDEIYLRTIELGDEKYATSWRSSIFPKAESLVEKWIKEDLPKEGKAERGHLLIIRKADDVVIGSVMEKRDGVASWLRVHVDPLYGDAGQRWRAEATTLATDWLVNERFVPAARIDLAGQDDIMIERLLAFGYVETARFRQMYLIDGKRQDRIILQFFNAEWMTTLGNPMDTPLERTGSGEPRPVPPKSVIYGTPPKNAILVGERVYLRPEEKSDMAQYVEWARKEEETFFDIGRHLVTEVRQWNWVLEAQKEDYPDWIQFGVYLRETDDHVGSVCLIDTDFVNLTAETGSFFHRADYRAKGYGSEAKQLLLEYAFDVLGLHMVESWVYFPNTRSAAALRKQGYREAGRVCWLYPFEGSFGNMVVFDLLAEEWRAMPREKWSAEG